MKLYTVVLDKFIDLPTKDPKDLRMLLDDIGLEVKGIEESSHGSIFTIETLANRGDHTYALGVAREISARLLTKIKHPSVSSLPDRKAGVQLQIDTDKCSRVGLLEMIFPKSMTLRDDIEAVIGEIDSKRLPPLVNVLNYVALELGQPMHAFDKDKIEGELILDHTTVETTVDALDGKRYVLPIGTLVHRDRKKILDVAGIIGCSNSMVTDETTRVIIESASFDPIMVRKTARAIGISTEASYTFERGSDVEMNLTALKRVIYLTQDGTSNSAQPIGLTFIETQPVEKRSILVSLSTLKKQINAPRILENEIFVRLKHLGYQVEHVPSAKEFTVNVPTWRLWDTFDEQDIVEDFVRSHGLNNIKQSLPSLSYEIPEYNPQEKLLQKIEAPLIGNGFFEVITKAFYSAADASFLESMDPTLIGKHVTLTNSIESSFSHLKLNNILHIAKIISSNLRMGLLNIKIFDFSKVYENNGKEDPIETEYLTLAASGRWHLGEWRKAESLEEIFFLLKGVVQNLLSSLGKEARFTLSKDPLLHPGMQCSVVVGRDMVGTFGVIHPLVKDFVSLKQDAVIVSLKAELLMKESDKGVFSIPVDLPLIRRDITLQIGKQNFAEQIFGWIESLKINHLVDIALIDDFTKESEKFRRVTYRLSFQDNERTLEHSEVDLYMNQILERLKNKHQIELAS